MGEFGLLPGAMLTDAIAYVIVSAFHNLPEPERRKSARKNPQSLPGMGSICLFSGVR